MSKDRKKQGWWGCATMGHNFELEEKDIEKGLSSGSGHDGENKCASGETHPFALYFCSGRYADAFLSVEMVDVDDEDSIATPSLVPIHRVILASASPYFDTLFSSVLPTTSATIPTSPKQSKAQTSNASDYVPTWSIRIRNTDPLRTVLEYCYFSTTIIELDNWRSVLMLARRFRVKGLISAVENWVWNYMRRECEDAISAVSVEVEDEAMGSDSAVSRTELIAKLLTDAAKCPAPLGRQAMQIVLDVVIPPSTSEYEKYLLLRDIVESANAQSAASLDAKEIFAPVKLESFSLTELEVAYEDPLLPKEVVAEALMKNLRSRMTAAGMLSGSAEMEQPPPPLKVVGKKDSGIDVRSEHNGADNTNNIKVVAMRGKSPVVRIIHRDDSDEGLTTATERPVNVRYDSKFDVSEQDSNSEKEDRPVAKPVPLRPDLEGFRRSSDGAGESLYSLYGSTSSPGSERSTTTAEDDYKHGGADNMSMQLPFHPVPEIQIEETEDHSDRIANQSFADLTFSDPALMNQLRAVRQQLELLKTQPQQPQPPPQPETIAEVDEEPERGRTPELLDAVSQQLAKYRHEAGSDSQSTHSASSGLKSASEDEADNMFAGSSNCTQQKQSQINIPDDKWFNRNTFRARRGVVFLPTTMEEEDISMASVTADLRKDKGKEVKREEVVESEAEEDYLVEDTITEIKVRADRQKEEEEEVAMKEVRRKQKKENMKQPQHGPDPEELSNRIRAAKVAAAAMTRGSSRMLAKSHGGPKPAVTSASSIAGYHFAQHQAAQHSQRPQHHSQQQPQMATRAHPVRGRSKIPGENTRAVLFPEGAGDHNSTDEGESVASYNPAAVDMEQGFQPLPPVMGQGTVGRRSALFKPLPNVPPAVTALTPSNVLGIRSPSSPSSPDEVHEAAEAEPYPLVGPHSPVPLAAMPPRLKHRPANQNRTEKIMTFSRTRMSADSLAALAAMDPDAFNEAQTEQERRRQSSANSIAPTPPAMISQDRTESNNNAASHPTWGKSSRNIPTDFETSYQPSNGTVRGPRNRMSLPAVSNAHNTGTLRLLNAAKHVTQAVAGVSSTMVNSASTAWAQSEYGGGRTIGMADMKGGKKRKGIVGFFNKS
ncbi:hypothetical protein HK097_006249 [Rhizophlyctis rosea]|uniref:BTB domain-containing protein n=1 Tax=Rhizophlyctis rosea TaxID=64517 RepID=A0AAD5SCZ7_9FUNG|nr:hypothetical protein HK097_006249 [Rhizophlyctis rosea]